MAVVGNTAKGIININYKVIIKVCLYQLNDTSKSYLEARNTYSIICSFGW